MINVIHRGNFEKTNRFFRGVSALNVTGLLQNYGRMGVDALAKATPKDTGETASSWNFEIINTRSNVGISWTNSKLVDRAPLVILLQYGHAGPNGCFVSGKDFINPAIKPIFETFAQNLWKEVQAL
jgi:hypothetical protein